MLAQLENRPKVVGVKQTRRALRDGRAAAVFLARDADPAVTEPVEAQSAACQVPVTWVPTMRELGTACGISVGAAVAAAIF